jgi:hypothetical protein
LGDRIKVTSLGGRKAVESEIKQLQETEKSGQLDRLHCFIFDQDRNLTALKSSKLVRVVQWDRYCLENYLLNLQVLYDVLSSSPKTNLPDRGDFNKRVKELALQQIPPLVARKVYEPHRPASPGLTNDDISDDYADMAGTLTEKLQALRQTLNELDIKDWKSNFLNSTADKHAEFEKEWDSDWASVCDGKSLFENVCREYSVNRDRTEIKKQVIRQLRDQRAQEWQQVNAMLVDEFGIAD